MNKPLATVLAAACAALPAWAQEAAKPAHPNLVYILADDLGYGDVHCNNPQGKIPTPNLDRLAAQGMRFTDAHSGSAVCTPTRYGILTGRYAWRSHLQSGVLGVYDKPLIAANRLTVPALLKQQGYATACIGKWHLGWSWPEVKQDAPDFTQPIANGPITRGFDYYFGTDVPNYPPYCFIENDRTVGLPTATLPKRLLANNLASKPGPALPNWSLEEILPTLGTKASGYIGEQAKKGQPFFLYLPLTAPHTPIAPTQEWQGKSGLGGYADLVMEVDGVVGQVLDAIEKRGQAENTIVIFTSDNGCAPYIGVKGMEKKGHFPSGPFRGYKADIWDGGHRIPFIVRWPGQVKAGSTSDQTIGLTDLMATCAEITGAKIPETAGEDSVSILPILKGTAQAPVRESIIHHSINGSFSIRQGDWKLELCASSGGWSVPKPGTPAAKALPPVQLYDLAKDPGEKTNVQAENPEIVKRLTELLKKQVAKGRSTPGAKQKNDVEIRLYKEKGQAAAVEE